MSAVSLATAMRRARKDPIARLLAGAAMLGVRFRIRGADLEVAGAEELHLDDRACLRTYLPDIRARLEPPASEMGLLERLGVDVEVITELERAEAVLTGLGPGAFGLDIETAPITPNGAERPWIVLTKAGRRAVHQPRYNDKAALDPLRARPRLVQIYVPAAATVYVLDFAALPFEVLRLLEDRHLIIHNAGFELMMLAACGIRLRRSWDSLQLARLALGAERGGLRLGDVAAEFLDLELPKEEGTSDWSAPRLSAGQLQYAAADAVVAYRIARHIWAELDEGARAAFRLGNASVPVVAAMRLVGVPFARAIHMQTIATWEETYNEARATFRELTGEDPPARGPQMSTWLEVRLPERMLAWWPRTATGLLRTMRADLDRLGAIPAIRPLLEVLRLDKRLCTFGHCLLEKVSPDGRLRMDLKAAWTKSGRCSCSDPNLQQLPQDVRRAVVTSPGRTLVIADYSQIELRVVAELASDEAMRQVFRDNIDMHRLNASRLLGIPFDEVTEAQRATAKSVGSFGVLYGSGASGIVVAAAWGQYGVEMTEAEAEHYRAAFYEPYPQLRAWQHRNAEQARVTGVLRSIAGRPLRVEWEPIAPLKWTLCCNFPVQSSATDVMLIAMVRVHAALESLDAQLLLQVHDELVVECTDSLGPAVAALVEQEMLAAWRELFPEAPANGLVDVAVRPCWAKPPKEDPDLSRRTKDAL
jgi:DNA polymerase I